MRLPTLAALFGALALSTPAAAQIYWQAPDFRGAPIAPGEAGIGVALPDATADEDRANIAWQMRAALNVAALQCQFDRTLMTQDLYNGVLTNHRAELDQVYKTLAAYFKRTNKAVKAGQQALDRYGTKTYIGVSTVRGQFGFCQTASKIGQAAIFTPRGSFTIFAIERLRELRNSLLLAGEQQFRIGPPRVTARIPNMVKACWDGRGRYKAKCGSLS